MRLQLHLSFLNVYTGLLKLGWGIALQTHAVGLSPSSSPLFCCIINHSVSDFAIDKYALQLLATATSKYLHVMDISVATIAAMKRMKFYNPFSFSPAKVISNVSS